MSNQVDVQTVWKALEKLGDLEAMAALGRVVGNKAPGDLAFRKNVLVVDMWYPRLEYGSDKAPRTFDHPIAVEVGISDVRAADSIRIEYDFERDGYSIKQASVFEFEADDTVCDPDWQEVAFVQAWARERPRVSELAPGEEAKPSSEVEKPHLERGAALLWNILSGQHASNEELDEEEKVWFAIESARKHSLDPARQSRVYGLPNGNYSKARLDAYLNGDINLEALLADPRGAGLEPTPDTECNT